MRCGVRAVFWIIVLVASADASRGFATGRLLCFGIVVLIVGRCFVF